MDYLREYIKYRAKYLKCKEMAGGAPSAECVVELPKNGQLTDEPFPCSSNETDIICFNNDTKVELRNPNYNIFSCDTTNGNCSISHNIADIVCANIDDIDIDISTQLKLSKFESEKQFIELLNNPQGVPIPKTKLVDSKPIYQEILDEYPHKFVVKISPIIDDKFIMGLFLSDEKKSKMYAKMQQLFENNHMDGGNQILNTLCVEQQKNEGPPTTESVYDKIKMSEIALEMLMTGLNAPKNHHLMRMFGFKLSANEPEKPITIQKIEECKKMEKFLRYRTNVLREIPTKSVFLYMEKLVGPVTERDLIDDGEFGNMILHIIAGLVSLDKAGYYHYDLHSGNVMYSLKMKSTTIYYNDNGHNVISKNSNSQKVWKIIDYGGLFLQHEGSEDYFWEALKIFMEESYSKFIINDIGSNEIYENIKLKNKDAYNRIIEKIAITSSKHPENPIDITYPYPSA